MGLNMDSDKDDKYRKGFSFMDYWFHFGVAINLVIVALLVWFSYS